MFVIGICSHVFAQSGVSLAQCESLFLKNNLSLVAEQFNIEGAQAIAEQAKLWDNPVVSAELNVIDPQNHQLLHVGSSGQKALAIQQLLYLGGKKAKEVAVAKTNSQIAQLVFNDLLRNLKYQLRVSYFNVYYDNIAMSALDKQLTNLDTLIKAYNVQALKGNVPLKDVVRLQALYLGLKNEQTALANSIIEDQKKLGLLLATDQIVMPIPSVEEINIYQKSNTLSAANLVDKALLNRLEIALADASSLAAQQTIAYQKALAVPDLTLGASYDQRGGAFANQMNVTVAMPLKLWNKNQGNIKAANIKSQQLLTLKQQTVIQIQTEVKAALQKYQTAKSNFSMLNGTLVSNFDEVLNGVYNNFQKRNISLIEFTDFMESYHQSLVQFNQIRKSFTQACEEVNFVTNSRIF